MNRGEVYWVNFDHAVGGEIQKERPAVIVSNDVSNSLLNRLLVVPLTSNVSRLYPGEAYVFLNGKQYKALTSQLNTVSKTRVSNIVGHLSKADLANVEQALRVQLGLIG